MRAAPVTLRALIILWSNSKASWLICTIRRVRHNDLTHLKSLLRVAGGRPKFIVFESIYSMNADLAPIGAICDLAVKYNALTYLDEVHAVGMYGRRGGAVRPARDSVITRVDIIEGTLGKAFGCLGGYIATTAKICDAERADFRHTRFGP